LQTVATGDEKALRGLRRICAEHALLEIVIGSDPDKDRAELDRLGIPALSTEYIENTLIHSYTTASFKKLEFGVLQASEWPVLQTSWAKRLRGGSGRTVVFLIGQAIPVQESEL